ncbi:MAG: glycosyltransferase family 39 protein [Longimicrobiales bacterium]
MKRRLHDATGQGETVEQATRDEHGSATAPVRSFRERALELAPFLGLAAAYSILVLVTFRDYGITFDESVQAGYGERILGWYRSLFQDRDVLTFENLEFYGGFFDVLAEAAWRVSPVGQYETRHLVNAAFGLAGMFAAWRVGFLLAGRRAAFLAALFLATTPVWYGHSFNNPKDVPFATLFLFSLYYILVAIERFPRLDWPLVAKLGIAIGLTLGIRFGGILLFGYLGFAFAAWVAWRWIAMRQAPGVRRTLVPFVIRGGAILVIAWIVMLVWWPAAQVDPIGQPIRTLRELSEFDWNYPTLFEGRHVLATELPWTYLPKYFAIQMPEFVLAGVLAALLLGLLAVVRARGLASVNGLRWLTLGFAVLFPAAYSVATGAVLYDGLRHFLFAVPPLAITAAVGIDGLLRAAKPVRLATAIAVAGAMTLTVADMVRLHPNQYIWFNRLVAGGFERAAQSYETDYWGNAYKEAAEWVATTYAGVRPDGRIRVATCSARMSIMYYLDERHFHYVMRREAPDLFFGYTRFGCQDQVKGPVVHTVRRMNVPLVVVKEVGEFARVRESSRHRSRQNARQRCVHGL